MIFFWRAHTGYFIQSQADRTANYFAALYLAIDNICLTAGILFVPSLRAYYYTNASFGLTNDYIRLADQWFSSTLWPVAAVMLLLSLLCLPAAFFIAEYITGSNKEIE
jgi:hypothetical protein